MAKKKIDENSSFELAALIRKALRNQGTYSPDLEMAVMKAAGDLYAYYKALHDMEALPSTFYSTLSREGNTVIKEHPVFNLIPKLSQSCDKSLKSLGLTLGTLMVQETDPLEALVNKVKEMED